MASGAETLVRQRFGIVRIAAGAFDDLAALDLPASCAALAAMRAANARVEAVAARLRDELFARIRGCEDAQLRRRLLQAKRDLFNGRRADVCDAEYDAAVADADVARERFLRAFEAEVAAARERLHALAKSEELQRPLALSSLALLAQIRRRITRQTERAVMKYVSRMHVKTSPFSTFCHVALATFGKSAVRLGEGRVHVRENIACKNGVTPQLRAEELRFEDSILGGEVVCDADAIGDTIASYVRDLSFTDPAIARGRRLRREFETRYGRDATVPLERVHAECGDDVADDDAIARWTSALASQLTPNGDSVHIGRQHVDYAFAAVPELRRELPQSIGAILQFTAGGAMLNNLGPGYGKFVSRFLDLLPPEVLEEQRAINRAAANGSRLVEFRDDWRLNMNLHPPLVDGEIGADDPLFVKIGDDDSLWLLHGSARIEVLDLGLQEPSTRSPLHQFVNRVFTRAEELARRPMVKAALAAFPAGIMKPRVIYDGRLIIRRRSWTLPKAMLPLRTKAESDAAYFARVDAWREQLGIPRYVFARIRKAVRRDDRKPQFISFASCHSVLLFEHLLARVEAKLTLHEMLPSPDEMLEWNGRRHAAEFVVQWNRGA